MSDNLKGPKGKAAEDAINRLKPRYGQNYTLDLDDEDR